jgi:vitamin B12/bleomycin/antimicrobial peptide transport system ATP-binding/permease protein
MTTRVWSIQCWILFLAFLLYSSSAFVTPLVHARHGNNLLSNEKNFRQYEKPRNTEPDTADVLQTSPADIVDEQTFESDKIVKQSQLFYEMAFPYYKESKSGRWLFAGMIGMTLVNSAVSVAFSYLGKDFWNALNAKDPDQFYFMLSKFGVALVVGAPVVVLYRFQRERLAVSWREWMTIRTLQLYSTNRVYYALERNSEVDNPDQRIAEDVRSFTAFSLQLFLTLLTSVIDLASFSAILYSIQPQLFVAIFLYAAFGTIVTTLIGGPLVGLNFLKLQKEADFRYALVRLRENAESIAFYGGEDLEGKSITERFDQVLSNKRELIGATRNLEFFTTAYQYLIQVVPVAVVAPQYFSGAVQLGVVSQSAGAFNHILGDLSIIVNQFESLSTFSAGIDRLSQFYEEMRNVDADRTGDMPLLQLANVTSNATLTFTEESIDLRRSSPMSSEALSKPILCFQNLNLVTPDKKRMLIENLSLNLEEGQNLLIVGNSGAGKSSLLRAIAGLWTAGEGTIERPADEDVYFLPQRPYCSMGSLKDQLLYPSIEARNTTEILENRATNRARLLRQSLTDADFLKVLDTVCLEDLATRVGNGDPVKGLDAVLDWSNMLSLGEQQRLAFGRLLVNQPKLVILDEATSALDMVSEATMYRLLQDMGRKTTTKGGMLSPPGLTYISVGHRPSLLTYHDMKLRLGGGDDYDISCIEKTVDVPRQISNL